MSRQFILGHADANGVVTLPPGFADTVVSIQTVGEDEVRIRKVDAGARPDVPIIVTSPTSDPRPASDVQ